MQIASFKKFFCNQAFYIIQLQFTLLFKFLIDIFFILDFVLFYNYIVL